MARISGLGAFFIIVAIVAFFGTAGWIIYTHLRARRLGLPQPTLASYNPFKSSGRHGSNGGVGGWVTSKINAVKNRNKRSAGGAYEEPLSSNVRGGRGHGPLDPDDAWDARVGTEADAYGPGGYYEEQELGLGRSGLPAGGSTAYGEERGRSRSREPEPYIGGSQAGLDRRYDEEMGRRPQNLNPFDDSAEVRDGGLRGVSPRPVEMHAPGAKDQDSPTERRSLFRENM